MFSFQYSLGSEHDARFYELVRHFGAAPTLLAVSKSWRGGLHVQSCGHHLHYDCRKGYCETLRQQNRVARDQVRKGIYFIFCHINSTHFF